MLQAPETSGGEMIRFQDFGKEVDPAAALHGGNLLPRLGPPGWA
jgi:hypothetical protein